LSSRGVLVRDRSREPGCQNCIRITAGVVDHTRTVIAELEALCGAR
jgi:histidinol-phosphate aminotransferase